MCSERFFTRLADWETSTYTFGSWSSLAKLKCVASLNKKADDKSAPRHTWQIRKLLWTPRSALHPAQRLLRLWGERVALVGGYLLITLLRHRRIAQRLVALRQFEPRPRSGFR